MASYQIPQFLDSGDKILGPLNMRQFAYALGGFFLCVLIFTATQSAAPEIGWYAVLPALPAAALTAYLSLGKYNGRDSEIYVLKFILFLAKPRQMAYSRAPYLEDIYEQESQLTYNKIIKEWESRVSKIKQLESNELLGFQQMDSDERARRIRNLGTTLDMGFYNTLRTVHQNELELEKTQILLQQVTPKKGQQPGFVATRPNPQSQIEQPSYTPANFFEIDED